MVKAAGLGDQLFIDGYDLSGDVGSLSAISMKSATLDVTGIDKSAHERVYGLADGEINFQAFFNDAANQAHARLKAQNTADIHVAYFRGTTLGNAAACLVAKKVNYDPVRGADGSLTVAVQCLGNAQKLEWGRMGTAGKRTDTGATNGASIDDGADVAALDFGLAAYLQVFAFTGTSVTVAIQESSDDAAADPFAAVTGGAFAAATGIGVERIQTGLTLSVERYLRVVTTGTFTNAVFAVAIVRYLGANQEL